MTKEQKQQLINLLNNLGLDIKRIEIRDWRAFNELQIGIEYNKEVKNG